MRKIEKEMNRAINQGYNWSSANTKVHVEPTNGWRYVYLHGHHIATVDTGRSDWNWYSITPNLETLSQWPTNTTKSRLRALGVDVYTKAGTTYVNGSAIA